MFKFINIIMEAQDILQVTNSSRSIIINSTSNVSLIPPAPNKNTHMVYILFISLKSYFAMAIITYISLHI